MAQKNKIMIKTAKNKQTYVSVKSKNNETIATTETYKTKQGAKKAAEALQKIIKDAELVDKTK